jgi:arylformamidase
VAKVYRDYTQEELDRQYEHRHIVPNMDEFTARNHAESVRVRAALKPREAAYGPGPRQKLDIYAAGQGAPIMVYLHGGRWQMNSKETSCHAAECFTRAGIAFVAPNFRQAPDNPMDTIIADARAAVVWAWQNAASFGGDRNRLYIAGASSGGHMAGVMVTTDWTEHGLPADAVKGGLLVSGMHDLEPVRLTFRNEALKLDAAMAARNSPIRHIPSPGCPLVVAVGALESDEFKRQSRDFAAAWQKAGNACTFIERDGKHHYSLGDDLDDPESPLLRAFFKMIGASASARAAE